MSSRDSKGWSVGPWRVESRGLAACGNPPALGLDEKRAALLEMDAIAPLSSQEIEKSFVQRRSERQDACRVITKEEVEQLLEITNAGDDVWEQIQADEKIQIRRHRNRNLFGGAVFVKLEARLATVSSPADVAHCFLNFEDRTTWDKQMDGFSILHNVAHNDMLYSVLHAPPLADRDFLVFHTLFTHERQKGLMFYSRSADNSFSPSKGCVRATQYVSVTEIMEDPVGGVKVCTTTAVDPNIPFLPRWIMNLMVPSEFRKWVAAVDKRCGELARAGITVPCAHLFVIEASATEADAQGTSMISTKHVEAHTCQPQEILKESRETLQKSCASFSTCPDGRTPDSLGTPDSRGSFPMLLGSRGEAEETDFSKPPILEDEEAVVKPPCTDQSMWTWWIPFQCQCTS